MDRIRVRISDRIRITVILHFGCLWTVINYYISQQVTVLSLNCSNYCQYCVRLLAVVVCDEL